MQGPAHAGDGTTSDCGPKFAMFGQQHSILRLTYSGLGRTPEIPVELAKQYPRLQSKLENIGVVLREQRDSGRIIPTARADALDRLRAYGRGLSTSEVAAIKIVVERLHDTTGWSEYAKELTLAGAQWIHVRGSTSERHALQATGEISQRAMLAAIAERTRSRGEVLQKFDGTSSNAFNAAMIRGPLIDNGGAHGRLVHLIQMDYIAPTLESLYGRGSREFYRVLAENNLFLPLFDLNEYHFGSPTGITYVLGQVLPVSDHR